MTPRRPNDARDAGASDAANVGEDVSPSEGAGWGDHAHHDDAAEGVAA